LRKLSFVDLNRNAIAGSIPDEFDRLIAMEFFDLRYNKVTGHLPLWMGARWPELKALSLSNNHMSGVLPEGLGGLQKLKTLTLANNNFTASLNPIMNLKSLEFLYLEKNRFEGNVDDEFLQDMENLVQVDISSNDLGGQDLPLHLFQHSSLQVLDLSDNSIMGTIPLFNILDNTAMQYLGLSDNILTGSLPESIVKLKSLRHLDVTGNDLIGTMPASLAGMPKLTYVFLSENGFDKGPIPDFFGDMKQLRELSLSGTQRTGALPSEWLGELNHLVLFDVSYNEMTGSIPSVIWEHPNLSYLLLNRNKFTGDLPAGISDDTKLNMLLLDNNSITGDLTEACQKLKIDWLIADCQEISCECCKCCADNEPRCNDDILYANNDFSWEYNYTRVAYAFSPEILFEATPKVRTTVGH
jgi:Leucine-rich repeat (LRR) protein